jgi:DNA-directed RNA polymerase III subunit RPC4
VIMSGRLPTLGNNDNKPKPFKFKPKVVQRKTKEEREAALKKLESEKLKQQEEIDKKKRRDDFIKQQQQQKLSGNRVPKYLQNTTLVSTGPLATGTFSGNFRPGSNNNRVTFSSSGSSGSGNGISSLIKNEHTELSLANTGDDSDSDKEDTNGEQFSNENEIKINMGKEYKVGQEDHSSEEEDEEKEDDNTDEDETKDVKFVLDHLFPVRPIKIKHEDLISTTVKEEIKKDFSAPGTKENTPELEDVNRMIPSMENMQLDELFYRNNSDNNQIQIDLEKQSIFNDYLKINKKLQHKKTSKLFQKNLMLLQLPHILPFEEKHKTKDTPSEPLQGEIGELRMHQSGKITIKFSNGTIMDVFKASETSFLQEVVAVKAPGRESRQDTNKDIAKVKKEKREKEMLDDEEPNDEEEDDNDDLGTVQQLGTVAHRYVTVPRL